MKTKRILSLILSCAMLLSLLPAGVLADDDPGYTYEDGVLTITSGTFRPEELANKDDVTFVVIEKWVNYVAPAGALGLSGQFEEYDNLAGFAVDPENTIYTELDGVLFSKDLSVLVCYPPKRPGTVFVIPQQVTMIYIDAFPMNLSGLTLYFSESTKEALNDLPGSITPKELNEDANITVAEENYVSVTQVTLSQSAIKLVAGDTATLSATVLPETTQVRSVTWSSSDETVATVDANGVVTAVSRGGAVITAATVGLDANGRHLTAACSVTVSAAAESIEDPDGRADPFQIDVSATEDEALTVLRVRLSPAEGQTVVWTSSAPDVALLRAGGGSEAAEVTNTVDAGGIASVAVLPRTSGTVTVTASAGGLTQVFHLNLSKWVRNVTLGETELFLPVGGSEALTQTIAPPDAEDPSVAWESSNTAVATVDANGVVTAVAPGDAEITVSVTTAGHTETASCAVKVRGIALNKTELSLVLKTTETLVPTLAPEGSDTVSWSSSDPTVVSVDADGLLTANALGTATITATAAESGFTAECAVTVTPIRAEGVSLDRTAITLEKGGSVTLTASLQPLDTTNPAITWLTTPEGVVSLSRTAMDAVNGTATITVTALEEGTASVIVTTADGSKQAVCIVTVPIKVKQLSLNRSELSLGPNQSETLTAILEPGDAADKTLRWFSSNESVVTVDENGRVTVNPDIEFAANEAPRTAVVSVQTTDGSNLTAQCTVTVQRTVVTHVLLDQSTLTLDLKQNTSGVLTATVEPAGATIGTVSWSSSDETVATVAVGADGKATVTAVGPGSAVIKVTTTDGSHTADCSVTVEPTAVTGVELDAETLNLDLTGDTTATLTATVTPADATNRKINWTVSDPEVAELSSVQTTADGTTGRTQITVTALKAGTVRVTATTQDGALTAACTVVVAATPVQSVTLDRSSLTLELGGTDAAKTVALTATVSPDDASHPGVTWISSDERIVTVDQTGRVTAVASGTATVTALSEDNVHKAVCAVTVRWIVTGVELQKHETTIVKGGTETLSAAILPDATNQSVTWSSSDATVATVGQNGCVTAVRPGSAVITATANNGNHDDCTVTVVQPTTKIELDESELALSTTDDTNKTFSLTATVTPDDSTDVPVVWSSSDSSVATVSDSGLVTAVSGGRAVITATSGNYSARCTVTIPTPVTGVSLNKTEISLGIGEIEPLAAVVAPLSATNQNVTWAVTSSTPAVETATVVTVDQNGAVTAVSVGSAVVTVTTADGGKTASCTVTVVPTAVTGVRLGGEDLDESGGLTLNMTDKTFSTLTAEVTPEDATDKSVSWTSSDETVATVANGTVTARKPGTAVITVTTASGGYKATCLVTVEKTKVTAITMASAMELSVTDPAHRTGTLTATVVPGDATNKTLIWTVDKPELAELNVYETTGDAAGSASVTVTAKKAGTVIITATSKDDGEITARCTVTIPATPVVALSLDRQALTLEYRVPLTTSGSANLTVTAAGRDGLAPTDPSVSWASSDTDVVTVVKLSDTMAAVTAAGPGTATVTVSSPDGPMATCAVTVYVPVTGITLNTTESTLTLGARETETLVAAVLPATADQSVVWELVSSEPDDGETPVVQLTADGSGATVTAKNPGTATVRVTAAGTGFSAEYTATVKQPTTALELDTDALSLSMTDNTQLTGTLTATVTPADSTDEIVWTISDDTVASVSAATTKTENGKKTSAVTVTARKGGTARITVTSGSESATAVVTIPVPVERVTLSETALTLEEKETAALTAEVRPDDAANKAVAWSSSDESVAAVDQNGLVTAKKTGTATITVTAQDGSGQSAGCTVTVVSISAKGVALDKATLELQVTDTGTLTATVSPDDAANKAVTWSSSDESVATVDQSGLVTAVGVGVATVTVTTADGGHTAACVVSVSSKPVQNITLDKTEQELNLTDHTTFVLTATVTPSNATNLGLTWTSSDPSVAELSEAQTTAAVTEGVAAATARITAKKAGTSTITVTSGDNGAIVATCVVTVPAIPVTELHISPDTLVLVLDDSNPNYASGTLTVAISPEDATDKTVSWSSSNSAVVEVTKTTDTTATVTAKSAGTAIITVSSADGTVTAAREVIVRVPAVGISLNKYTAALVLGSVETETLTATVLPSPGADPSVAWNSGDTSVATVENGVITAVGPGTAVITAAIPGTGFHADCTVTVKQPTNTVTVSPASCALKLNGAASEATATLTATLDPADATEGVVWRSNNAAVATVDQNGVVTAVGPGTATITASSDGKSAKSTVTVTVLATGVTLSRMALTLEEKATASLTAAVSPDNTSSKTVKWSSSDATVASVDEDTGVVTALKAGTATITATVQDGSGQSAGCAVTVTAISAKGVALDKATLELQVTDTGTLTATVSPGDAANKAVTWSSSNEAVATVDQTGLVTATGVGTTSVTVTTVDGGKTASCTVVVTAKPVTAVTLDKAELKLELEDNKNTYTLTATVTPANATNLGLTWTSSDPDVVAVSGAQTTAAVAEGETDATATATVIAKKAGTSTITVRSRDNGELVASCVVTIDRIPVDSLSLDQTDVTLVFDPALPSGGSMNLTATITGENGKTPTDQTVTWVSSDPEVVSVSRAASLADADGNAVITVSANKAGTSIITASAADGKTVTCTVTVYKPVADLSLNESSAALTTGDTRQLRATVTPAEADQRVTWTSSDPETASVDSNGLITAIRAGTVTITAASVANGAAKATCTVVVRDPVIPVTGIVLSEETHTIDNVDDSFTLTATLAPASPTEQRITWMSTDPSVVTVSASETASVNANGEAGVTVTAVGEGTAAVVATTADGAFTASCTVTVPYKVTKVALTRTELTLGLQDADKTEQLTAIVTPGNAVNGTVTWSSGNTNVATVDAETGLVTAVAVGKTYITATAGGFSARCEVEVKPTSVTRVTLDKNELSLDLVTATTGTLQAAITPADATNKALTWSSSASGIVTVAQDEEDGSRATVTAVAPGTAVVTVTSTDGEFKATCAVTVAPTAVTGIALDRSALELDPEDNAAAALTATLAPVNATNGAVTWVSSDPTVASVSADATTANAADGTTRITVTAHKVGTATITVTTADGAFTATCTVRIPETAVTGVDLSAETMTLRLDGGSGASANLSAEVRPADATYRSVTWHSSDEALDADARIVEIRVLSDSTVEVVGKNPGTATVTVTSADGKFTDSCTVTVEMPVGGVSVTPRTLSLVLTEAEKIGSLSAAVTPSTADQSVVWSSSDDTVATVDQNGVVTAQKAGTATITAKSASSNFSAACEVTVTEPVVRVTGVTLDKASLEDSDFDANGQYTLTAALTGEGGETVTDQTVTWSCSDPSVATVSADGLRATVTAVAGGRAEITVTTKDGGYTAKCVVTLPVPVEGVSLNKTTVSLGIGETEPLAAALAPVNASNQSVTWSVNAEGEAFVAVDPNGVVTAKAVGTATVTVTTADGGKTASCVVTVVPTAVTGITLDATAAALDLKTTKTVTLSATVTPDDATDKTVVWSSSDETVATVSGGVVTAVAPGTAVITAETASGGYRATCLVTVSPTAVSDITLSATGLTDGALELALDGHSTLTAAIDPADATDQTLVWTVSPAGVVELDRYETTGTNGMSAVTVTARKAGTATITAACRSDGSVKASVTVNVPATPVTSLTIPETLELTMRGTPAGASANLTVTVAPNDATDKIVTWQSADLRVVTVEKLNDTMAQVTAVAAGTTDVTVTCADGVTAVCRVTVLLPPDGITLSAEQTALSLGVRDSEVLTAAVTPAEAAQEIVWTIEASSPKTRGQEVVTLSGSEGTTVTLTAVHPGTATVRATAKDTGFYKESTVTVSQPTGSVTVAPETVGLTLNGEDAETTVTLTAELDPADATDTVVWSSNNESVATVDQTGLVTAVSGGTATITAASGGRSASCEVTVTVLATGVTLNKTQITLEEKKTETLSATVLPSGTSDPSLVWAVKSQTPVTAGDTVVTIDQNGKITAVRSGSAVVTATAQDGSEVYAECTVTVVPIAVTGLELSVTHLDLEVNDTDLIDVTILPSDAANQNVIWTSSDENGDYVIFEDITSKKDGSSIQVDAVGLEGNAVTVTLTATTEDGGYTAACTVTVSSTAVTGFKIDQSALRFDLNRDQTTEMLSVTLLPDNATDKTINWTISDPSIADIEDASEDIGYEAGSGRAIYVTAKKPGTATITATPNGNAALAKSITFTVPVPVTDVSLDETELEMDMGDEYLFPLTAAIIPSNAANQNVEWESDSPDVLEVEAMGNSADLIPVSPGWAIITVTTEDGQKQDFCTVTVRPLVESVTLDPGTLELTLPNGKTATLTATVLPAASGSTPGADQRVTWTSSNTRVATVDQNGRVTAVGDGEAIITARAANNGKEATCTVTVTTPVTEVELTDRNGQKEIALSMLDAVGDGLFRSAELTATVKAGGGLTPTNKTIRWESDDESVATVDSTGIVTAVGEGTATIAVITEDGELSDTVTVTVKKATVPTNDLPDTIVLNQNQAVITGLPLYVLNDLINHDGSYSVSMTANLIDMEVARSGITIRRASDVSDGVCTLTLSCAGDDEHAALEYALRVIVLSDPLQTDVALNGSQGAHDTLTATVNAATNNAGERYYSIIVTGYVDEEPDSWTDWLAPALKDGFAGAADLIRIVPAPADTQYGAFYVTATDPYSGDEIRIQYRITATTVMTYDQITSSDSTIKSEIYIPPSTEQAYYSPGITALGLEAASEKTMTAILNEWSEEVGEPTDGLTATLTLEARSIRTDSYELTPSYVITDGDGEEMGSSVLRELAEPITIILKLQYKPKEILHIHRDANGIESVDRPPFSAEYDAEERCWVVKWAQDKFSIVRLVPEEDYREGMILFLFGDSSAQYTYNEFDAQAGTALPSETRNGCTFDGWRIDGSVYTELTDGLLDAIDGTTLTAEPVFTKNTAPGDQPGGDSGGTPGGSSEGGETPAPAEANPFIDVTEADYCYAPVLWAAAQGITRGKNAENTFIPGDTCTREEAVTFLWRAAGCPEPERTENPFTDMDETRWSYQAILWAAEQGITRGTDESGAHFSPYDTVNRAQIVTFLYRLAQAAAAAAERFEDVDSDAWYGAPVTWACDGGITAGANAEGTLFAPDDDCTRAQIVTFLYRYFVTPLTTAE